MKKILLLLFILISTFSYSQADFPEGVQITGGQPTNTTPTYLTTTSTSGLQEKIPSAYIEKTALKTSTISGYDTSLYPNEKAAHDALDLKLNISDLPTNLTLYPTTAPSDIVGYVKMVTDIHAPDYNAIAVDVSTPLLTGTGQLISSRIADAGVLIGQPGVFNVTTFGNIRRLSGTGTAEFYFKVFHRDSAGVETLIATSSTSAVVVNGTYAEFTASGVWDDGDFLPTDRIVIKSYANRIAGGSDPIYQFQFGGDSPVRTLLPVPFSVVDAGYELRANKQNDLTPDGTGTKYSTVDAVNTIDLQKVVDVNGFSEKNGSFVDLLKNEEGQIITSISSYSPTLEKYSNLRIEDYQISINGIASDGVYSEFSITNGKPFITNLNTNTQYETIVSFSDPLSDDVFLNFPAKTVAGTYTLATTDDVDAVGLQQVVDVNAEASLSDGLGNLSNIQIYPEYFTMLNETSEKGGAINLSNGILELSQTDYLSVNSTFVRIESPLADTTINFPAKTVAGTYTLATTDIVTQTITNGVTDKSPSEDAVFDALDNVNRNIILDATPSTAVTSTLTETIFKSYFLPANTFSSSTLMKIPSFLISKTGTAGTAIIKIYFNSTNTLSGATQIATYTISGTTTYVTINRTFILTSGIIKGFSFISGGSLTDVTTAGNGFSSATFDTTTNKYIITSCTLSNLADSVSQFSFNLVN